MHIRRATSADAETLTAIAYAAKRHWGYADALIALWRRDLRVTPDAIRDDHLYCAEDDGTILGFYGVSAGDGGFELAHLWVVPARMGYGIGATLLQHATATVRSLGGTSLRIVSDPHAEGFYRRMGARRVGEVESTPAGRMLPLLDLDCTGTSTWTPRAWRIVCLASLGTLVAVSVIGGALTAHFGELPFAVRVASLATIGLSLVTFVASLPPVMVRAFIAGHERLGNQAHPVVRFLVRHERAVVRSVWLLWALGAAMALPVAICDIMSEP